MHSVFHNREIHDDARRQALYQGQLFVYSPTESSRALCRFARELSVEAFAPFDPPTAQFEMTAENYASVLQALKPKFIHHPTCKELIRGLLSEMGCDLQKTYFDVPRLRTSTSNGYLTSGLAYAFHPHRDTWYSAPQCQLNWWLPVYDIEPENCMAFHPRYWNEPVPNSSRDYNYYRWNKESRGAAAQQIQKDTRKQPQPESEIELNPQLRLLPEVGSIILFSAAHLHSSVPNTSGRTRFSIDFRTVHLDEVLSNGGAPNLDSECTGTTLRDYIKSADLTHLPKDVVALYDPHPIEDGVLVYEPPK